MARHAPPGWHGLDVRRRVPIAVVDAAQLLRRDPYEWLPAPVLEHGAHEFRCTLRPWGVPVVMACSVSGAWVRGDHVARSVRFPLAGTASGLFAAEIRGDVTLAEPGALRFDGQWSRPRFRLLEAVGWLVVRRLVSAFLGAVVQRLAARRSEPGRMMEW